MRYLGSKGKLLDFIQSGVPASMAEEPFSVFDTFAGTATVGRHFRAQGKRVYSCDIMYLSFVLQKAYLQTAGIPRFAAFRRTPGETGYQAALRSVQKSPGVEGYVFNTFTEAGTAGLEQPRRYFSAENGRKIDAARLAIEAYRQAGDVTEQEYFLLLATLLESVSRFANVAGVYAAFLKTDDPRSLKPFQLFPLELPFPGPKATVFHGPAEDYLKRVTADIYYLDPPYNSRQYAPNYHVLETLARYDDPEARGVAGIRDYSDLKSDFCTTGKATAALARFARDGQYRHLLLSYNSEGLMTEEEIRETLRPHGKVELLERGYRRFRSNNGGEAPTKPTVQEQLYVLTRR